MPLRDDILNPIPGDTPGGVNLRYDPIYAKIKEARREDDDAPQGEWVHERKVADWKLVVKLAGEVVATRSKDLQLASWLTEALVKTDGFAGLRQSLEMIQGLLDDFWDGLYPELEDGDAELRAVPLEWIGSRLDEPLRFAGLTKQGYDWFQYKDSLGVPTDDEASSDSKKAETRAAKIADGKITPEQFEESFKNTPKAFYVSAVAELDRSLELLDSITTLCEEKFGAATPSFGRLRTGIEEVRHSANLLLQKKRELEPDAAPAGEAAGAEGETVPEAAGAGVPLVGGGGVYRTAAAPEVVFQMAQQAARAGRLADAMNLLTEQLTAEASARGRFIRRTQMAQICLESGQDGIAMPILEDLAAEIDKRNLEEWEFGEVIARPLALLYRCMVKQDRDHEERMKLYARVCRLSPYEALTVAR
ncbi:MAG: type VI secretion system protein TssA [Acidobacteria bacterium]|nr:type VI secretion system protein TssA [Acidobacteriota bacterium]